MLLAGRAGVGVRRGGGSSCGSHCDNRRLLTTGSSTHFLSVLQPAAVQKRRRQGTVVSLEVENDENSMLSANGGGVMTGFNAMSAIINNQYLPIEQA